MYVHAGGSTIQRTASYVSGIGRGVRPQGLWKHESSGPHMTCCEMSNLGRRPLGVHVDPAGPHRASIFAEVLTQRAPPACCSHTPPLPYCTAESQTQPRSWSHSRSSGPATPRHVRLTCVDKLCAPAIAGTLAIHEKAGVGRWSLWKLRLWTRNVSTRSAGAAINTSTPSQSSWRDGMRACARPAPVSSCGHFTREPNGSQPFLMHKTAPLISPANVNKQTAPLGRKTHKQPSAHTSCISAILQHDTQCTVALSIACLSQPYTTTPSGSTRTAQRYTALSNGRGD